MPETPVFTEFLKYFQIMYFRKQLKTNILHYTKDKCVAFYQRNTYLGFGLTKSGNIVS